jgi:hypothetical protein
VEWHKEFLRRHRFREEKGILWYDASYVFSRACPLNNFRSAYDIHPPAHRPAHEAKLLGAHFFGLLREKKGAPRVYPWPARKATPLYVRPIIKDTLSY